MSSSIAYLQTKNTTHKLAYQYKAPQKDAPTIVYFYGFRSDMNGEKVQFFQSLAEVDDLGFLTFDYSGHGQSSGQFEEGTITQWLEDSLIMIDHLTSGPLIFIGSSMGGWLSLLAALHRPDRVVGLLGIASAPDFTEELMWAKFSHTQQDEVMGQGWTILPTEYNDNGWPITKNLIESGREHLLLNKAILLNIPVRLIHGLKDTTVPMTFSQKLMGLITSENITLTLVKSGDHRLSTPGDLLILGHLIRELVALSLDKP